MRWWYRRDHFKFCVLPWGDSRVLPAHSMQHMKSDYWIWKTYPKSSSQSSLWTDERNKNLRQEGMCQRSCRSSTLVNTKPKMGTLVCPHSKQSLSTLVVLCLCPQLPKATSGQPLGFEPISDEDIFETGFACWTKLTSVLAHSSLPLPLYNFAIGFKPCGWC